MLPGDLVGHEVPCNDGGDNGLHVLQYNEANDSYLVQPIRWTTGTKFMTGPYWLTRGVMVQNFTPSEYRSRNENR